MIERLRQLRNEAAARGDHARSLYLNDQIVRLKKQAADEIKDQVRNSDLYSPTVKRVMERFWDQLDAREIAQIKAEADGRSR